MASLRKLASSQLTVTGGSAAKKRAETVPLPSIPLWLDTPPVEELTRLSAALGGGARLLIKRDDVIPFGGGGNKVRKLALVAARALEEGADTLITCGGMQSNHARATAAVAARLGLRCVLVQNGTPPERPTGNALLARLYGAEIHPVASREEREPAMKAVADSLRRAGRRPFVIPLGASMPLGAAAYAAAVDELLTQTDAPDAIVHASSSGGTQAGLVAGVRRRRLRTTVLGVSADETAGVLGGIVGRLIDDLRTSGLAGTVPDGGDDVHVDAGFVGAGYGVATQESREALELFARHEAILLDPTYTAKAAAALVAWVRSGRFASRETVLFWHTGGVPGLFA
jgi:1-aminocyclopropane-1-carboxylate deaminase/D-cysteine desulfhydrase-like pyridoxal-dependent ACC family enzyme